MQTTEEIKRAFHPIPSKEMTEVMKACIQKAEIKFVDLCEELLQIVPPCADRTAAFRKIMEAKFTCIQAITHHQPKIEDPVKKPAYARDEKPSGSDKK